MPQIHLGFKFSDFGNGSDALDSASNVVAETETYFERAGMAIRKDNLGREIEQGEYIYESLFHVRSMTVQSMLIAGNEKPMPEDRYEICLTYDNAAREQARQTVSRLKDLSSKFQEHVPVA